MSKRQWILCIILGIVLYFSFVLGVSAMTDITLYYDNFQQYDIFTDQEVETLNKYFETYYKDQKDKVVACAMTSSYEKRTDNNYVEFVCGDIIKFFAYANGTTKYNYNYSVIGTRQYFKYDLQSKTIESISSATVSHGGQLYLSYNQLSYTGASDGNYNWFWLNNSYVYEDLDKDRELQFVLDDSLTISERYTKFYNIKNYIYTGYPIYSVTNLILGNYGKQVEIQKYSYKIEYYFDDVLDTSKTEYLSAELNSIVKSDKDYSDNLYKLYEEGMSYELKVTENEENNVLKIYYRSPLYGTDKNPIDTKNEKVWFFFQFNDIKNLFPNVEFGNFNQFEQFVVTLLVNLYFCLFLLLMIYITLKSLFKAISWLYSYFI